MPSKTPDTVLTTAALLAAAPADAVFAVFDDPGIELTYGEQLARVHSTAAALAERGAGRGDRVHVSLPNGQEFLDLWFATAYLGAVLVPTNPQSTVDEYRHIVADAEPVVSIAREDAAERLRQAGVTSPLVVGSGAGAVNLAGGGRTVPEATVDAGDPAAILYTSGTTSRPKGVVVTHANYVAVGRAVADQLSLTHEDRWFIALPLFHANAQYYCTMSALVRGASIAVADRFSASRWGTRAARLGATLGSLFAAPIRMILANPPGTGEAALRAVLFAQNLSAAQAAEFEARFTTRLVQLYGMTETILPPTMNPNSAERRWDSIGRVLPSVELGLTDDDGNPVPPGDAGEIRVRGIPGETIAAGYWHNPEATAETFGAGWLRTGDLARCDKDGFLYFVDRAKDMIKRSGENISAGEVERVVAAHPAIAECAVIGIPDPVYDEAVLLIAVAKPEAGDGTDLTEDILRWCRERLAAFKVPSRVEFVESLPRTSVGKIRKSELRSARDECADRLGVQQTLDDWILCRDNGEWTRLRALYAANGRMRTTGPSVPADEYLAGARAAWDRGELSHHVPGPSRIRIAQSRAVAETQATVNLRRTVHAVEVDLVALVRYVDRLVLEDGRWRILDRLPLYLGDRMVPVRADERLTLRADLLGQCPDGARFLVYAHLAAGGGAPDPVPISFTTPESDTVLANAESWLRERT